MHIQHACCTYIQQLAVSLEYKWPWGAALQRTLKSVSMYGYFVNLHGIGFVNIPYPLLQADHRELSVLQMVYCQEQAVVHLAPPRRIHSPQSLFTTPPERPPLLSISTLTFLPAAVSVQCHAASHRQRASVDTPSAHPLIHRSPLATPVGQPL